MTAMPGARRRAIITSRWAAPCFITEGVSLMVLGLASALLPRFADLGADLVLGWTMILAGLLGAASVSVAQGEAQPASRLLSAAAAVVVGALALRGAPAGGAALTTLIIGFLGVDAAALVAASWLRRRRAAAGWGWLAALAAFDLVLGAWLAGLTAMLTPAAVGLAIAARFILGGMALAAMGVAALQEA